MSADESFMQAILADPEDHGTRLVYADWLEERGDPRGEYLRLEEMLACAAIADERVPISRRRMIELRSHISSSWLALIGSHRSSGSDPDPERVALVAKMLGRPVTYVDAAGYQRDIVAAAENSHTHAMAYVESRQQQRGEFLDINFHLRIADGRGHETAWEVESYNPYFGCRVRFLEWYGETVVVIYEEKHSTYICRFGIDFPAQFRIIEWLWVLDGWQLGYWRYKATSVRRLTIPQLEELPALSEDEASKWELLPAKHW